MKRIFFFAIILCTYTTLRGRTLDSCQVNLSIFGLPTSESDFKTLIIPIKRVQNLIIIEARIDTLVGNFILDTGSPSLVLNKTYFRHGWARPESLTANAAGDAQPLLRTDVNSLTIKELFFEDLQADLSDLGHIENRRGLKVLGLLGVSLFTSFEMVIDLNRDVMYLHKLDREGNVPVEEKIVKGAPTIKVPFQLVQNIITTEVMVAGRKMVFCLDTGAETNALSNMLPGKVLQTFRVTKRMLLLGTGGSTTEVLVGTLDEITIGAKSFRNMHAAITRLDDLGDAYGRKIDGILGNNFLVKGIISINFVKKELCMFPFDVGKP